MNLADMATNPAVSVCLPTYNSAPFIKRTIRHLQSQTYSDFRVLISDDASTDETVEFIKLAISGDGRFELITHQNNIGWVENTNFLLNKAALDSKYVFIHPHDDIIAPGYIQTLINAFQYHPGTALICTDIKCYYTNGQSGVFSIPVPAPGSSQIRQFIQRKNHWWVAYRGMMSSEVVLSCLPKEKNIFGSVEFFADWTWLLKISTHGKIIRVPEVLYTKYYQPKSLSVNWESSLINILGNFFTGWLIIIRSDLSLKEKLLLSKSILFQVLKHLGAKMAHKTKKPYSLK